MAFRCPICRREALARAQNPAFPFCSDRCREIDLGKWLTEEYRVAGAAAEIDEDGKPALPGDGHAEDDDPQRGRPPPLEIGLSDAEVGRSRAVDSLGHVPAS